MSRKLLFFALVALLGFSIVGVLVFQGFFMASVIPHGGIF
jgi:hypothetical protein